MSVIIKQNRSITFFVRHLSVYLLLNLERQISHSNGLTASCGERCSCRCCFGVVAATAFHRAPPRSCCRCCQRRPSSELHGCRVGQILGAARWPYDLFITSSNDGLKSRYTKMFRSVIYCTHEAVLRQGNKFLSVLQFLELMGSPKAIQGKERKK